MCGGSDSNTYKPQPYVQPPTPVQTPTPPPVTLPTAPTPVSAPTPPKINLPSAPNTPNARSTADQQYMYNQQAGLDALYYNTLDQYGPLGSTVWARDANGTPYAQSIQLSPELQAQLDAQFGQQASLYGAAQKQLGYLPQGQFQLPADATGRDLAEQAFGAQTLDSSRFADPLSGNMGISPTDSTSDIAATSYEQAKSLFQPDLDAARKQKEIQLAQRGINPGDEIWRDEMDRLDRQANQAYSGAARQATLDAGQEQSRQFGQNLSSAEYDLGRRGFLSNVQQQQFSQLAGALGYGDQAYQQGIQNELLQRSVPFQEAQAYMQTAPQYALPQFQQAPQVNFNPADYTGVVNNNTAAQAKMYGDQVAAASDIYKTQVGAQQQQYGNQLQAQQQQYGTQMGAATNIYGNQLGYQQGIYGAQLGNQAQIYGAQSGQRNANVAAANQPSGNSGGSGVWGAVGTIGSAIISDEDAKEDRSPADGEMILARFREMPVDDYRYRDEAQAAYGVPEHRTGAMAQDYAEHFGGDGKTIDMGDAIGKLMAAMKALDARTRKTENA